MNLRINLSWQSVTTTTPSECRSIADIRTSMARLEKKSTLFLPFINWRRTNYVKNWKFLNNRPTRLEARVDMLYWTTPTVIMTKQVIFNSELLKVSIELRGGPFHCHHVKKNYVSSVELKTIWTVHLLSDRFDLFRQWLCAHTHTLISTCRHIKRHRSLHVSMSVSVLLLLLIVRWWTDAEDRWLSLTRHEQKIQTILNTVFNYFAFTFDQRDFDRFSSSMNLIASVVCVHVILNQLIDAQSSIANWWLESILKKKRQRRDFLCVIKPSKKKERERGRESEKTLRLKKQVTWDKRTKTYRAKKRKNGGERRWRCEDR